MDYQERLDFLSEIQEMLPVNEWRIDGIRMWPFILHEINIALIKNIIGHDVLDKRNTLSLISSELIATLKYQYQAISDRYSNNSSNEKSDIVFLTQAARRVQLQDSYYDRVCDPFFDAFTSLNYHCIALEWTYEGRYKTPRHNTSAFIQPIINALAAKSIFRTGQNRLFDHLEEFDQLLSQLETVGIDSKSWLRTLEKNVATFFSIKKYFKGRLSAISPKYAFVFPYYGVIGFAFVAACKDLNIKAVDIQHGYYSAFSIPYSVHKNIPGEGYEMLPNYFWCWRASDRDRVLGWSNNSTKAHLPYLGGNLWNNIWLAPDLNMNADVAYFDKEVEKIRSPHGGKHHALVTLSPFFTGPDWLFDALEKAAPSFRWWIRLHHNTSSTTKGRLYSMSSKLSDVELEKSTDIPLPSLLHYADVHITIESGCTVEAAEFGVPSIIVSAQGASMYSELISSGWAAVADNQDSFIRLLEGFLENRPTNRNKHNLCNRDIVEKFMIDTSQDKIIDG